MQNHISIPIERLAGLAVEHWRLSCALGGGEGKISSPAARHALRKMDDFFRECQLEIRSLDGLPYDAGLNARVVDTLQDASLAGGMTVVTETIAPLILHEGVVVRPAEIVLASASIPE